HRIVAKCWNINQLPIDYAFLPRLRGRLTLRRLTLREESLGFRRAGFSPALSLLMSAFALPIPPADLSIHLHRRTERSSTAHTPHSTSRSHSTPRELDVRGRLGCLLRKQPSMTLSEACAP